MSAYHCELAWLGGDHAAADVLVEIEGDRITSVTADVVAPPPGATRLPGLTLPGFANGHSHAFHRALRGRTHGGIGSFWTWRDAMYRVAADLDPDGYLRLARAAFAEMALAGIATVGEFHYLHHDPSGQPYDDPNVMAATLLEAAAAAGVRITLLDACYLRSGIDVELAGAPRRFGDGDALGWATRASELRDGPTVRIGAAIHSVRTVDPAAMSIVAAWAAERGAPLHAHVSEQPAENEQCLAAYGRTPTALLADHGVLGDRFTAVHATHVSEADTDLLGEASCWCCICPTTERDLADGIGPARDLRDAGVRLTVGTDSHAVIDVFEEARAVELNERLASGVRGNHDAPTLLRAAGANGHASLGWADAGELRPGALADLTTVGLDSVRTAGTTRDNALEAAVFAASAADVHHVVVGGRAIVVDGYHTGIDVASELRAVLA